MKKKQISFRVTEETFQQYQEAKDLLAKIVQETLPAVASIPDLQKVQNDTFFVMMLETYFKELKKLDDMVREVRNDAN